jgi:hypothetical protein
MVAGIRHELDSGARLVDFGADVRYLRQLANAERPLVNFELIPRNRRTAIYRARLLVPFSRERIMIWRGQLRLRTRLRALRDRTGSDTTKR